MSNTTLRTYAVNLPGPSHIDQGIPCQDSYEIAFSDGAAIAAVADGVGSERYSDLGSAIAAKEVVEACKQNLPSCTSEQDVLDMMRAAYWRAYDAVLEGAAAMGKPANEFDSTLCTAILDGGTLHWGQSGDSGIVAAMKDGTYRLVTRMQRDDEGRVYTLCFDERWKFGTLHDVSTVMLCTDGVLENMAPLVLRVHSEHEVDTRLARMFLHPQPGDAANLKELEAAASTFFERYPRSMLDDDKTAVVVFDERNLPGEQPAPYYEGPDWDEIARKVNAALYRPGPAAGDEADAAAAETAAPSDDAASPAPGQAQQSGTAMQTEKPHHAATKVPKPPSPAPGDKPPASPTSDPHSLEELLDPSIVPCPPTAKPAAPAPVTVSRGTRITVVPAIESFRQRNPQYNSPWPRQRKPGGTPRKGKKH